MAEAGPLGHRAWQALIASDAQPAPSTGQPAQGALQAAVQRQRLHCGLRGLPLPLERLHCLHYRAQALLLLWAGWELAALL